MDADARKPARLPEAVVEQLLVDLCVQFGLCLPPRMLRRLGNNPPATAERFASVVYRAEGLDPSLESDLFKAVRSYVTAVFAQHSVPLR